MKAQVLELLIQEKQKVEAIISDIRGRIEYNAKSTQSLLDPTPRNIVDYKYIENNLDEMLAYGWQKCNDATDFVKRIVIESPEAIAQRQHIPPHRLVYTSALHRWYRIATGKLSRIEKCIAWIHQTTQ